MFEVIKVFLALTGSTVCGLYDLKTTNMLDWLAIAMIITGFGLHVAESFIISSFEPLIMWFVVVGAFFLFSLFMYYAGYWGGGDGELLIAIGSLLPVYGGSMLFSLDFFINTFLVGGLYSIVYAIVLTIRNPKIKNSFFKKLKRDAYSIFISTLFLFSVLFVFFYILTPHMILFPIIISFLFLSMLILYRLAKAVEKLGFYKRIPVSRLREGDMIGEDIPKLGIYKKLIRGLTKDEIKRIRKVKKYVIVREGVRYGPVFPLALAFTLVYGSVFSFLI